MRRRRLLAAGLLAGGAALAAPMAGCSGRGGAVLGFVAPLSGRRADLGEGGRNGALLAVELANEQGGVDGRPLQLRVEDDRLQPEAARAAFERLQAQGLVALVGGYTKPQAEALAPLAAAAGVPVISPNLALTPTGPGAGQVFRINLSAADNAAAYAHQLVRGGQRRIAVIAEQSSLEFVQTWLRHFRATLQRRGAALVHEQPYRSGIGTSFAALAAGLPGTGCDGLMLIGPTVDVARLCQQLRDRLPGLPVASIDRTGSDTLVQLGGQAMEGLVLLQAYDPDSTAPAYTRFVQRYQARFNELPGQSAVLAHDATAVAVQALRARHTGATLAEKLREGGPFEGLQHPLRFDAERRAPRSAWFTQVRGGRLVTLGAA